MFKERSKDIGNVKEKTQLKKQANIEIIKNKQYKNRIVKELTRVVK